MGEETMVRVSFTREQIEMEVDAGTTVLEAEIRAGLRPDAPCGGAGKCGKCLVRIGGETVKACQVKVESDLVVDTLALQSQAEYEILSEGFSRPVVFAPGLAVHRVRLEKAAIGDNRSDWERLLEALEQAGGPEQGQIRPDPMLASSLYERRREAQEWYVIHTPQEILELRREEGRRLFAAFDVGTTTVVGYLLDAADGRVLAVESCLNPQAQYGGDVIMRANYALEHGVGSLSSCIRESVNGLLQRLAASAFVDARDIFEVSIVGNTCMHHLFLGISPGSLAHAPYTPAIREWLTLEASDYGLQIHPKGRIVMLPDIAGYVGADTCGCLMTVRPDLKEEITLMLDIGTNGEMVLGNRERLVACSTAAGPAFEGAKIECGMRGAAGAVDHVSWEDGVWRYTTVGGEPAVGLCGSGLIDLVAQLLKAGLIDDGGKLESGQEDPHRFVLVPPEQAGNETGVYLTQKDIREVQLAKAAIAAGMQLLMQELSVTEEDVKVLYIAGAFGNYMDPASAGIIGMIPQSLVARVQPIGNAAGEGAKIALVNQEELREAEELVKRIDFVELASSPDFQDCFVDELGFEEI